MDSPKFARFKVLGTTYKTIDNHNINTYTLVPKTSPSSPSPVVVKFHGGFLVTGTAIFADWFPQWLLDYVTQHNAVVVLPNYRLLPEATGMDVMEDLEDFWTWLKQDFHTYLNKEVPGTEVDLGKVLVTGESAGGYLSIQSALGSSGGVVKASIATYPVLDIKSRFFTQEYEKDIGGTPTIPKSILAEHLEAIEQHANTGKKSIISSAIPPDRRLLAMSIIQQGLYAKILGEEKILYPLERLDDVSSDDVPPILILHGEQDSAVPVEGSKKWTEAAKSKLGREKVSLILRPGEHGFDNDPSLTPETDWLKSELERITKAWLDRQ